MTNSLGQASQRQLPLETPQSLGPLHAEFPLVHVGSSVPPCLCTFCSLYRNALLPLPSPASRSSFKTQFRCLPLREEVHCPLFCIPTAPCPCLGKSTDWGSLTISSRVSCHLPQPAWGQESLIIHLCVWDIVDAPKMFVRWMYGWHRNTTNLLTSVLPWFVQWVLTFTHHF